MCVEQCSFGLDAIRVHIIHAHHIKEGKRMQSHWKTHSRWNVMSYCDC